MRSKKSVMTILSTVMIFPAANVWSQGQLDRLKNSVKHSTESKVENAINKKIDRAVDHTFNKSTEPQKNQKPTDAATAKELPSSNNVKEIDQEQLYKHFSFIPGEDVLLQETFDAAVLGELPANWNSNSSGNIVTIAKEQTRWLNMINGVYLTDIDCKTFGESYSIEFDLMLNVTAQKGHYLPYFHFGAYASGGDAGGYNKLLANHRLHNAFEVMMEPATDLSSKLTLRSFANKNETFRSERLENRIINERFKKVFHVSISVTKGRLQLWIDQHKLIDIPKAISTNAAPINQLFFKTDNSLGYNEDNFGYLISNIKVASGIKSIKADFLNTGKLSTTGIVFNTNSDKLHSYSYGIIAQMATVLAASPDFKIRIIGHTDTDGQVQTNKELSLKRAIAVKNALVDLHGINANRIETDGKGSASPVADNKTKEGKAANRRVEFVRM